MKISKSVLTFLAIFLSTLSFGQRTDHGKLIELGRAYKDFMFRNEANKEVLKAVNANVPDSLKKSAEFIAQTISSKNKLLTDEYLSRPDENTLKQLFIIRSINLNLREENQIDNNKLIDSLTSEMVSLYVLVDNYYGMLFTAIGNKNQPFDLSKVDFKLDGYQFRDETEKGIFVLRCMRDCNSVIWGYMNVAQPPNTKKAYDNIKKFPRFNGRTYYQYTNFYFADFEMNIVKDKGMQSYKSYYLDKYFETLIFHLICLNKEGGTEKEKNDLLLGSILKSQNLYKYTKYKETLEDVFKEQKQ